MQINPQRMMKYKMLTLRSFILTFVPRHIFQRKLHQVLNASALSGPLHPSKTVVTQTNSFETIEEENILNG